MSTELTPYQEQIGALSVRDVRDQVNLIQHIMREVMQGPTKDHPEGVHYGVIPGTPRPTLLKAGAEKLCLVFRLAPDYEIEEKTDGVHLKVTSKCTLTHIPSGQRFGSGMGSCSTKEAKYAFRKANRKCPNCGKEAIIKGKDFKGTGAPTGWLCFAKRGGCGAKFPDGDAAIESQSEGRVPNEDIADTCNTVLKMANKRSLVAAVLNATAASDIFTQDIEDTQQNATAPQAPLSEAGIPPVESPPAAAVAPISADQHIALMDALRPIRNGETRFLHQAGIERLTMLPASEYRRAMAWCEAATEQDRKAAKGAK